MMDASEVMDALEAEGSAQTRKIYARHGANEPMFGVSYAALGTLAKRVGRDHELALTLWATGNHDARQLAAKIADPEAMTVGVANDWARDADCYITAGALAGVVAVSPLARCRSDVWRDRRGEWVAAAGWGIVAHTAEDSAVWSETELIGLLDQIEGEIHDRPNRVRHEMVQVIITIGLRSANLRRRAVRVAGRVGAVSVDHGETNCTTPEPIAYIDKTLAHRERRDSRKVKSG